MPWHGPDGVEVAADALPPAPQRTWQCSSREFKRLKAAAQRRRLSCTCLPVLSPHSVWAGIWYGLTNLVDLTYTAFIVAISMAFNYRGISFNGSFLGVLDVIGSIVYVTDLAMGFQLGVVARWKDRAVVIKDGRTSASFYVRKGTFWTDFIATVPLFVQVAVAASGNSTAALRLIFTLRLLRLIRVFRLLSNLSRNSLAGPLQYLAAAVTTRSLLLLHAVFSLAVLVNLLGCIWWNLAENEGLENSWAASLSKDFDLLTASNPQRWLVSCYFALTTMVTIGYGDITPVTIKEIGVTMMFEIVGVAFFGYVLNVVTSLLTATGPEAKRSEALREKLEEVEDAMMGTELPILLRRRVRHYFSTAWAPPDSMERKLTLLCELPPKLRQRLMAAQQLPALRELGFFPPGMAADQQRACTAVVAAASAPVMLDKGQTLQSALASGAAEAAAAGSGEVPGDDDGDGHQNCCLFVLGEGRMSLGPDEDAAVNSSSVFTGPAILGLAQLFAAADPDLHDALVAAGWCGWRGGGAVALTSSQLWRVDCAPVFPQLRRQHPGLLQHLALKLVSLVESNIQDTETQQLPSHGKAAPGADGGSGASNGSGSPTAQAGAHGGVAATAAAIACKALRQLASELGDEDARQRQQASTRSKGRLGVRGAVSHISSVTSWGGLSPAGRSGLSERAELEGVAVAPGAPPPLTAVWHCD